VTQVGGTTSIGGPASQGPHGFSFPALPGSPGDCGQLIDDPAARVELHFAGEVRFSAHGGQLAVTIADPWVTIEDGQGILAVIDPAYLPDRSRRMKIARLTVAAATDAVRPGTLELRAALTTHGSQLLGEVYPVGTELAPLRFSGDRGVNSP
jgi:hypothetical protein